MRITLLGASGRLGAVLSRELASAGHDVAALTRRDLDVRDAARVRERIAELRPEAIVNCTAYNAVDRAESEPEAAFAVNRDAVAALAGAAARTGAVLVHYSTDFVFDGRSTTPYREDEGTNPVSVYGRSKLAGEAAASAAPRHYVLRVESLFGGEGVGGHRPTVDYIADSVRAGRPVRAFIDRTVSPSYVPDVAHATRLLLERGTAYGTYHCVSTGCATWLEVAAFIARTLGVSAALEGIRVADVKAIAPRPAFFALSNDKLRANGIPLPTWQSAIARHLGIGNATDVATDLQVRRTGVAADSVATDLQVRRQA